MKFSMRLRMALSVVLVLLAALALSACSKTLTIDEDAEGNAAGEVIAQFMLAMGDGDLAKAIGYFDSTYSQITMSDLALLIQQQEISFDGISKVEVTSFTANEDPNSKTKIRGHMSGAIHYKDDVRLFTAELVKDNDTWYLIFINFHV